MDQIHALIERNAFLEEENRQLRGKHLPRLPRRYGHVPLTPCEIIVVAVLESTVQGSLCTVDHLLDCIIMSRPRGQEIQPKAVSVHICRLKRKFREAGVPIVIRNLWGEGYWIDETTKAQLRAMREGTHHA